MMMMTTIIMYLCVGEKEDGVLVGLGRLAQDDLEVLVPLVRRVRLADLHLHANKHIKLH